MNIFLIVALMFVSINSNAQTTESVRAKYAPETVRLFDDMSYFGRAAAPDKRLLSFYEPQGQNMCQSATLNMVLNAIRSLQPQDSNTENLIQAEMVAELGDADWVQAMAEGKCYGLDKYKNVVQRALNKFVSVPYIVRAVHVNQSDLASRAQVLADLSANEASAENYIIANFDQAVFSGEDPGIGHISPVGAYDEATQRVLIMDVDRQWYTPYWVSVENFIKAMGTNDGEKTRGYLVIEPVK